MNTDNDARRLCGILGLAARKAIIRKWLSSNVPSLEDWQQIVYGLFVMERITFTIRLQTDKFDKIWDKWKTHIRLKHSEFV